MTPTTNKPKTTAIALNIFEGLAAIDNTPDAVFELTILHQWRGKDITEKGYFSDRQALATTAAERTLIPNSKAVWVNLQTINAACLHRAFNRMFSNSDKTVAMSKADVCRYRNFLIDLDRKGIKEISATDAEKQEIRERVSAVEEFLLDLGWPDPKYRADSGNGYHICFALDLPVTQENQNLLVTCYQALQQTFGTDTISIDKSLADPNQLIKLYGTMTRKGDDTEERPHRWSALEAVFDTTPVTMEQLQKLAALFQTTATEKTKTGDSGAQKANFWQAWQPEKVEEWAESRQISLGERTEKPGNDGRSIYTWPVPCLTSDEHTDGACFILNEEGWLNYKCHHNSCSDKKIADVFEKFPPPGKIKIAPYIEKDGQIFFRQPGKGDSIDSTLLTDFTARIVAETTVDDGQRLYQIAGETTGGRKFSLEIDAGEFEGRELKAALGAAAGAMAPIYPKAGEHLATAIKFLSDKPEIIRRYTRTGWVDGQFLIHGRAFPGIELKLPAKLNYSVDSNQDVNQGITALQGLMNHHKAAGSVLVSWVLTPALAHLAGWRNERCGLFIKGRTGTHKTTTAQLLMSVWGAGYLDEDALLRWGAQGGTSNAFMAYATSAADLPFLVDNYKPNTGGGDNAFVSLIHAIVEGGNKDRLSRASRLIEPKPIHAWPLFTGEDMPDKDAASLARVLVVQFQRAQDTKQLTAAQHLAQHLPAVGAAWLAWLESPEGQADVRRFASALPDERDKFVKILLVNDRNVKNPYRVATNLAINLIAWRIIAESPLGELCATTTEEQHRVALSAIAADMASATAESLEAERFLSHLRALLATGGAELLTPQLPADRDNKNVIGWKDNAGGAYIDTDTARQLIQRVTGDTLNAISERTLLSQLDELGAIGKHERGKHKAQVKIAGVKLRLLHLPESALNPPDDVLAIL